MTEHDGLRDELRALPEPSVPVPPPDLADIVLDRLGRQRRSMRAGIAVAVIILLAALPLAWVRQSSQVAPPADPPVSNVPSLPAPGGGPSVIQVYTVGGRSFVLDPEAGAYREFPFEVVVSADLSWAAVLSNGRVGVAARKVLLRDGAAAVTWLDTPPVHGPVWSPDSRALLVTELDRRRAHHYDPVSSLMFEVPLHNWEVIAPLAWAADSVRYAVTVAKDGRPTAMHYVARTGKPAERIEGPPGVIEGYSPSGRHGFVNGFEKASTVFYAATGTPEWTVPYMLDFAGWYDDGTVALVDTSTRELILVDVITAQVEHRILLPGIPDSVQITTSQGLPEAAAAYGF